MKNKRILITGAAGFIGSELSRQLSGSGNQLILVDNLVNGKIDNIREIINADCRFEQVDIRDLPAMKELAAGIDCIFHLACLGVRHSIHSPLENHDVNATSTLNLLTLARAAGVKRFLYCSSSEVYGTAQRTPMDENHPAYPMTVYGASKLAGECYARAFHRTYGFPVTVVRPFNSFGPRSHHEGDSGEVIPKFILRSLCGKPMLVFGDGTQTRDFTYVSDTAAGIIKAAGEDAGIGETFNLGSCMEISINKLAETVRAVIGNDRAEIQYIESRPGDVLRLFADSSKAAELLKFKPRISLADGLQRLLEWYKKSGKNPEDLLIAEKERNWEA